MTHESRVAIVGGLALEGKVAIVTGTGSGVGHKGGTQRVT